MRPANKVRHGGLTKTKKGRKRLVLSDPTIEGKKRTHFIPFRFPVSTQLHTVLVVRTTGHLPRLDPLSHDHSTCLTSKSEVSQGKEIFIPNTLQNFFTLTPLQNSQTLTSIVSFIPQLILSKNESQMPLTVRVTVRVTTLFLLKFPKEKVKIVLTEPLLATLLHLTYSSRSHA